MRNSLLQSTFVAFFLLANAAFACTGEVSPAGLPFTAVNRDCSFRFSGSDQYSTLSGQKAQNLSSGVVSQVMVREGACLHQEYLLVADCASGASIIIMGSENPPPDPNGPGGVVAGFIYTSMENSLAPNGPLDFSTFDDFADIVESASLHQLDLNNPDLILPRDNWWARVNPTCGCQIYYPDSPGASQ